MRFWFLSCALFCFSSCDYIHKPIREPMQEPTLVAQKNLEASVRVNLGEHQTIRMFQEKITPIIDTIIQEELNNLMRTKVSEYGYADSVPQFVRNTKCHFTLVYLGHIEEKHEILFVKALEHMQKLGIGNGPVRDIALSDQVDFFGDSREELVIKIHDTHNDITKLHNGIRQACIDANTLYHRDNRDNHDSKNKHDLFSLKYSDRYPFVPHVSLGKISGEKIRMYAQSVGADGDFVFQTIKQKVLHEVTQILKNFKQDNKIYVHNFQIYSGSGKLLRNFSLK